MNITPILKKLYREGSYGPGEGDYKGECVPFVQALVSFPAKTGNMLADKINFVKSYGIMADHPYFGEDFQVGDAVFTTDSEHGHVAFITFVDNDHFEVSESNFKSKKRVSHGRQIKKNDPKIIGICRFPFIFNTGFKFPLKLKVCFLMNNYDKQWDPKVFAEIREWYKTVSGGKIELQIFPLYTNFKNWWYDMVNAGGVWTESISLNWWKDNPAALAFSNENKYPDAVVLAIKSKEWQGKTFNYENLTLAGGYYGRTKNAAKIIVVADEEQKSTVYPGKQLFQCLLEHELAHWLYYMGQPQGFDMTHVFDGQGHIEKMFAESPLIDYERIFVNL